MPCFVPFKKSLDISVFVLRPSGTVSEDLFEILKNFSVCYEEFGCINSSILKSIHGNMVIWLGTWLKRSSENRRLLCDALVSSLSDIKYAHLVDYGFYEAYAGESHDGSTAAKFSSGDIISINAMFPKHDDMDILSYSCLALLKSFFLTMPGVTSGVIFRCDDRDRVACLHVWKSLELYYTWLLNFDHKNSFENYVEPLVSNYKYDVYQVIYVNSDDNIDHRYYTNKPIITSV